MSYLDNYKRRLQADGNNSTDGIVHASKQTVKNNFSNSLFSELVLIDDVEYEVIVTQEKKSEDKKILLKPDTKINIGSVVKMKDLNYLTLEFLGDGINEIYPTATLKLCNETINLSGAEACTVVGQNAFGEDIVECTTTSSIEIPCVVERTIVTSGVDQAVNLPEGRVIVTLPNTVHDDLSIGEVVLLYGEEYEIRDIDYTKSIGNKGILILHGKKKEVGL